MTNTTKTVAKQFEAAIRAALAQSKAEADPVKKTTRPVAVQGFEGWKVRYSYTYNKFNGFAVPHFNLTGPTGRTARASTGRLAECCTKAVREGNGTPVDTIFVTVLAF